jgi:hypothetical protein
MRLIKKRLSLSRIVLISCVAAIGLPIAPRVVPTATAVVNEQQDRLHQQITVGDLAAETKDSKHSKTPAGESAALLQDDYYDRRREYWEKRLERDLDDEEDSDDNDEDNKATKDSKKAADDEDDENDDVEQEIERRREYWQKRLDKDW